MIIRCPEGGYSPATHYDPEEWIYRICSRCDCTVHVESDDWDFFDHDAGLCGDCADARDAEGDDDAE